jgi:serine/threonine protein phosphatase PrpC
VTEPVSDDTAPRGPLRLRYAAVSDVGRHRKDNQDSGYASEHLLVIADGVGGAAYGDVASSTAVHLLRRLDAHPSDEMLPALAGVVHRIHDRLAEMVEGDRELEGTSTTVTAALFDGEQLGMAHVGDSRAYLVRDGRIDQLTKDHTFVQTLIDEGRITEEDSRVHPHRNIILRAVDGVHDTEPDLFMVPLQVGDRVLLCSDGCSGALTDHQMATLLGDGSVDSAAVALVQGALDGGTTDNVTVIVAEVVPAGGSDDPETSAAAAIGPMLVGAASAQPRRGGKLGRVLSRQRHGDTGELDPVEDEPVDPEELRYAPRPPHRRAGLRRILVIVTLLVLVAALLTGAYLWSQQQYYVAEDGPQVAIYRGVQLELPGIDLSDTYEVDDLKVADLSEFNQAKVEEGIVADDLEDARRIVQNLTEQAEGQAREPDPSPTDTPSEKPSDEPSARPSDEPSKSPTRRAAAAQGDEPAVLR